MKSSYRAGKEQVAQGFKALPPGSETVTIVPTMDPEVKKVLQAMTPAQKLRAAERLYWSARQLKAAALRAEHRTGQTKPSAKPSARFSSIPDTNLFLMFTRRLNTLGVPYMVSESVAVIIYGDLRHRV